jgi:hypothetical protein
LTQWGATLVIKIREREMRERGRGESRVVPTHREYFTRERDTCVG